MISEIRRTTAYVLVGISLIMLMHEFEIFTIELGFDKILVSAILTFILEAIIICSFLIERKRMKTSDIIGLCVFPIAGIVYIGIFYLGFPFIAYIQMITVIAMFIESIYALGI